MKKKIKAILNVSPLFLYECYRDTKNEIKRNRNSQELINRYFENLGKKKLQIGCGNNFLKGWLNTDINGLEGTVYLDAGKKFPFENESFDFIFSEHLFEHLTIKQQINMMTEAYRILKNGGVMRLATPKLDFLFELYSQPEKKENKEYVKWAVRSIPNLRIAQDKIENNSFHYIYVINNFFRDWGHQMIHNFESIQNLAFQSGFAEVIKVEVGESEIEDLRKIEKHGTIIPEHINKLETMVVEIIK